MMQISIIDAPTPNKRNGDPRYETLRRKTRGQARAKRREEYEPEFVAVDGEGLEKRCLTPECDCAQYVAASEKENSVCVCGHDKIGGHEHVYVLLACGDQPGDQIENENGLSWPETFHFLYGQFVKQNHGSYRKEISTKVYVGFYLAYDFAQILKGFELSRAVSLFSEGKYEIKRSDGTSYTLHGIESRRRTESGGNHLPYPVEVVANDERYQYEVQGKVPVEPDNAAHDGRWQCDMLMPTRRLRLRPKPCTCVNQNCGHVTSIPWMYICDAGPFFQSSFLKAIDPGRYKVPIVSREEYAEIREGKERRSTAKLDDDMRHYNLLENRVLPRLMSLYARGLSELGVQLRPDQWYGPGQSAQEWLKKQSEKVSGKCLQIGCPCQGYKSSTGKPTGACICGHKAGHTRGIVRQEISGIPADIQKVALQTYYGGWFEIMAHGHLPGDTWEYDINSAYPHIMASLPCFDHGEWKYGKNRPPKRDAYRMCRVQVLGRDPHMGPLPFRTEHNKILRPQNLTGWYWQHEIEASERAGLIEHVTYHEWWEYVPCACPPPVAGLKDLYLTRINMGKDTAVGIAAKLVYNSVYGKFAQQKGEKPPYQNALYASLTTVGCRVMILDAIASHPQRSAAVTMVATDAVYFRSPHPGLDCCSAPCTACREGKHWDGNDSNDRWCDCNALGYWGMKVKHNLTQLMPGVYWDDKARNNRDKNVLPQYKSRGVNPKYLWRKHAEVDDAFSAWHNGVIEFPNVSFTLDMSMITAYQAIRSLRKWYRCGTMKGNAARKVNTNPEDKRNPNIYYDSEFDMWRSSPYQKGPQCDCRECEGQSGFRTHPYNPKRIDFPGVDSEGNGVTPDGPNQLLLAEALGMEDHTPADIDN